jgi:hypothetical protein
MAKGDVVYFQEAMLEFGKGTFDLSSDTLKCGIVDDTLTPVANIATPNWSDYSANEVATTGNYTSGGETLTTVSWAMASGIATLTADDVVVLEHASGFTDGYWAIIFSSTASNAAIFAIDLGGPESEQAGDVSVEFSSGIVLQLPANVTDWATPVT